MRNGMQSLWKSKLVPTRPPFRCIIPVFLKRSPGVRYRRLPTQTPMKISAGIAKGFEAGNRAKKIANMQNFSKTRCLGWVRPYAQRCRGKLIQQVRRKSRFPTQKKHPFSLCSDVAYVWKSLRCHRFAARLFAAWTPERMPRRDRGRCLNAPGPKAFIRWVLAVRWHGCRGLVATGLQEPAAQPDAYP